MRYAHIFNARGVLLVARLIKLAYAQKNICRIKINYYYYCGMKKNRTTYYIIMWRNPKQKFVRKFKCITDCKNYKEAAEKAGFKTKFALS